MFITPTLCGRTVDTAFHDDESYVSGQPASLRWIIRRDRNQHPAHRGAETSLRARLFERDHRTVRLTRAGEILPARARLLLDQRDDVVCRPGTGLSPRRPGYSRTEI